MRYRQEIKGNCSYSVLFLHAFGGSLDMWSDVIEQMKNRNESYRYYSIDVIGFGISDAPRIVYDVATLTGYLRRFVESEVHTDLFIVGSSMGGTLAISLGAELSSRLKGLVLLAPSALPGSMRHPWPGDLFYRPGFLNKLALVFADTHIFKSIFPSTIGAQALYVTGSYDDTMLEKIRLTTCPVLLIWSTGDGRVPFEYSKKYLELMSSARLLEKASNLGHMVAQRDPANVSVDIGDFISKEQ